MNTLRALTAIALHQGGRALHKILAHIKPEGLFIPTDAPTPITFTTSEWWWHNNTLVIADQHNPVIVYPRHITTLRALTVATTLDDSGCDSDTPRIYVMLSLKKSPWALMGRDHEGFPLEYDTPQGEVL